jgi:RHS repeat-associated protein
MHQDPVAKSKRVTDGLGGVVSTIELDPWGGETNRSTNEAFQPRRFTTYEQDSIGSHDAMNRRYNRWWARFEQPDPYGGSYNLTDPQSFNRYSYVRNDPVNFVDPNGLDPDCAEEFNSTGTCTIGGGGGGNDPGGFISNTGIVIVEGPEPTPTDPGGGPQSPSDTSEVERLLTESCVHFLNGILAELGKIRDPYGYNFRGIFRAAKSRTSFDTVRLTAEQKKGGLGGTHSTISDPNFYIELDQGLFNRGDLTAGYVMIHELFHGAPASGSWYTHTDMAQAAYNVTLSNPAVMNKLKNTNYTGPPRQVDYTPGGKTNKADDWYNSGIFDAVVKIGCPIPPN